MVYFMIQLSSKGENKVLDNSNGMMYIVSMKTHIRWYGTRKAKPKTIPNCTQEVQAAVKSILCVGSITRKKE
jgi:hypothetical protein